MMHPETTCAIAPLAARTASSLEKSKSSAAGAEALTAGLRAPGRRERERPRVVRAGEEALAPRRLVQGLGPGEDSVPGHSDGLSRSLPLPRSAERLREREPDERLALLDPP